jgi:hypothetical protein
VSALGTARRGNRTMARITGAAHSMRPYDSAYDELITRAGDEVAGAPQGVAAARALEVAVAVRACDG